MKELVLYMCTYISIISTVGQILPVLGVEKNDFRHHYFSSNHHEAPAEIIQNDAHLEMLVSRTDGHPGCGRRKRPYTNHDEDYWNGRGTKEVWRSKSSLQIENSSQYLCS